MTRLAALVVRALVQKLKTGTSLWTGPGAPADCWERHLGDMPEGWVCQRHLRGLIAPAPTGDMARKRETEGGGSGSLAVVLEA